MGLLLLMGDSGYDVRSELFSQNEQGTHLDPSTYISGGVYQDSNGVTACSAPGDLVGLVLDQRQGALSNLGPEIHSDPLIENAGSWSVTAGVSIAGGKAVFDGTNATGYARINSNMVEGKWYLITVVVDSVTAGSVRLLANVAGNAVGPATLASSAGTYRILHLCTSGTTGLLWLYSSSGPFNGSIESISVREVPGNHAYQSTSGARPTLGRVPFGGRRNLFNYTDLTVGAASGTPGTAPTGWTQTGTDGTLTVMTDGLRLTLPGGRRRWAQTISLQDNTTYSFSVICDIHETAAIHQILELTSFPAGTTVTKYQDGALLTVYQEPVVRNNTELKLVVQTSATAGTAIFNFGGGINAGPETMDITFKKIQLEVGSNRTNYQRVVSTHDTTEAGQPDCWYLDASGSKWMQTNAIDFSATDEMTVIAGVRKLSDAARAIICELGNGDGRFVLEAPGLANTFLYTSRGTGNGDAGANLAAPVSVVATGQSDISGDSSLLRLNGSQVATGAGDQGTGNYANAILYIGCRGPSPGSIYFNGHLFHFIARGRSTTGSKLTGAERFTARKTGITI